ncbi:serine/threonine-protein kinase [Acidovorax delafieldii]|uniref:CHASE2 domain-containing serine/threonine-protein kinase n=1 Tax=Acidovorax delafieldii TaxID=47920 RepID=UPI00286D66FB|nr:serine/threonine-protein kinase [Acidovorax delafieldii]
MALAVAGLCAVTGASLTLEHKLYDAAIRTSSPAPLADVVIVGIDDASLAALGPWPWSRDIHARLIDRLSAAGAQTVVYTPALTQPQSDRGLAYLRKIRDTLSASTETTPLTAELGRVVGEAEAALDGDALLAASIQRAGNVFLASRYENVGAAAPLPAYVRRSTAPDPGAVAITLQSAQHPIPSLGTVAAGVGHVYAEPDNDGRVRQIPLLLRYDSVGVPSLALLAVQHSLHLGLDDLRALDASEGLRLGGLNIPTNAGVMLRPRWQVSVDSAGTFPTLSAASVLDGTAPAGSLKGKIVLVGEMTDAPGATAVRVGERLVHPVEELAQAVSSMRLGLGVVEPGWAMPVTGFALALALLYVVLVAPRLARPLLVAGGGGLVLAGVVTEWTLLRYGGLWLSLLLPVLAVLTGTTVVALLHRGQRSVTSARSAEAAEADRMMGLALQGQGQLDMAFERLRKVPASGALLDNLYHLAEDFERKRHFGKAQAVYEHILRHDRHYKDARSRYKRAKAQAQGGAQASLGAADSLPSASAGTPRLPGDASVGVPMLGRYQIDREIGKGAMGVVYLGRDPKIGRVVAIKTLALGQEFEGDALIDARARFFREAETAGRLQHPNIVTIFDAGEEHDLAYIAMEFLKGQDLTHACGQDRLLPVSTVLSIAARVADALDYAHAHNVVHRDIKPANIMFDSGTDAVKVTDFGIARITDSSKTRTGLVLGTPSFMSPEQLAGKKVDGRSDLYSLGITLFQLLTGTLPLRGASMTELMHKIASVEAPDVRQLRPELSAAVAKVVALSLQKRPEARYQTGRQFAADLRQALAGDAQSSPEAVVYDADRDATGQEMADFQETVVEPPAVRGAAAPPISGAP